MLTPDWKPELPLAVADRAGNGSVPLFAQTVEHRDEQTVEQRWQDFVELIAHEMRNSLSAIIGYSQLMERRGTYDERAIIAIVAQSRQLNRIVGDLLDSTGLDARQLRLQPDRMDLAALARDATEQTRLVSPRHSVRLEVPDAPLEGWWDPGRLAQVMANLLDNAIKYSPDGGEVLVRVEDLGATVRMSVEDQGPGIPPSALPHLFDQFYRAPATAGQVAGHGLGLHITRILVEVQGGRLTVESLLGQGTVFSFTLPRNQTQPGASVALGTA